MIRESETTNYQLARACKKYGIPLMRICFKDELTALQPGTGGYILNLADAGDQGTHWVALWKEGGNGDGFYFDSFGGPPPNEIKALFERLYSSKEQLQSLRSGHCGQYCINFLHAMSYLRGTPKERFKKFLKRFKPIHEWEY